MNTPHPALVILPAERTGTYSERELLLARHRAERTSARRERRRALFRRLRG